MESLFLEAGADAWPNEVKINIIDRLLSRDLQQAMVSVVNRPKEYAEYANMLAGVAENLSQINKRQSGSRRITANANNTQKPATPATPTPVMHTNDQMDWQPTTVAQGRTRPSLNISKKEYDARKANGACLGCGQPNTLIRNCKRCQSRQPTRTSYVKVGEDLMWSNEAQGDQQPKDPPSPEVGVEG